MPLREEFEATGNWLFRWRSYLPLALIPVLAAGLWANRAIGFVPPLSWTLVCFAVSLAGLALRIVTVGCTPKGTSGRNTDGQRADEVNSTGIYSIVRHPLYLGNFLMWLGVTMYSQSWWLVVIVSLLFWLYYERIMFAEEEYLRRKFGDAYMNWAAKTPAFLPSFRHWQPPALRFSLRNVLKREYSGMLGVILTFAALIVSEHLVVEGRVALDPAWQGICLLGIVLYFVLRSLKRQTRLLEVEGR